jgi:hypothetical protein
MIALTNLTPAPVRKTNLSANMPSNKAPAVRQNETPQFGCQQFCYLR